MKKPIMLVVLILVAVVMALSNPTTDQAVDYLKAKNDSGWLAQQVGGLVAYTSIDRQNFGLFSYYTVIVPGESGRVHLVGAFGNFISW